MKLKEQAERWDKHAACWQKRKETIQRSCNPKGSETKTHKRLVLVGRTKYHLSETWISLKPFAVFFSDACFSLQQEPVQQLLKNSCVNIHRHVWPLVL